MRLHFHLPPPDACLAFAASLRPRQRRARLRQASLDRLGLTWVSDLGVSDLGVPGLGVSDLGASADVDPLARQRATLEGLTPVFRCVVGVSSFSVQ